MTMKEVLLAAAIAAFALSIGWAAGEFEQGTEDIIKAEKHCAVGLVYTKTWSGRMKPAYLCPYGLDMEFLPKEVEYEGDKAGG